MASGSSVSKDLHALRLYFCSDMIFHIFKPNAQILANNLFNVLQRQSGERCF